MKVNEAISVLRKDGDKAPIEARKVVSAEVWETTRKVRSNGTKDNGNANTCRTLLNAIAQRCGMKCFDRGDDGLYSYWGLPQNRQNTDAKVAGVLAALGF